MRKTVLIVFAILFATLLSSYAGIIRPSLAASAGRTGQTLQLVYAGSETTAQIMARQASAKPIAHSNFHKPVRLNRANGSPTGSAVTTNPEGDSASVRGPLAAFTAGLGFNGPDSTVNTCGTPPDTMGTAGPTQFIVTINCNFTSYNKTTGAADGVLATTPDNFFSSLITPVAGNFTSDPHIRYDRLTQRWYIVMIDVAFPDNRVLFASSNTAIITGSTVWTKSYFGSSNNAHTSCLADYPTPGVDVKAMYIGVNQFCGSSLNNASYDGSDLYIIPKSRLLSGSGPISAFLVGDAINGTGLYTPQGVDSVDPAATEGHVIGVDLLSFTAIDLLRIANPGSASPTVSAPIVINTVAQGFEIPQPHQGNTGGSNGRIDGSDGRMLEAVFRNGSLWTSVGIGLTVSGGSCVGVQSGLADRDGLLWWEIRGIGSGATPSIRQQGIVCDTAAANPTFYSYGTIASNGQGHAAMGYTIAGATHFTSTGIVSRLATDTLGAFSSSLVTRNNTTNAYNPSFDPGGSAGRRWGDFSMTAVDPCDDMTVWTIQEYADQANQYGEWIQKLQAPPPPASNTASRVVPHGVASALVTLTGTSVAGSGFFDTTNGVIDPGCGTHLSAIANNGVTVNGVTYIDPTHITLNLNTTAAALGASSTVTITNPDGQTTTATVQVSTSNPHTDTIGVFRAGKFYLRNANTTGFADITVAYTFGSQPYPIVGDWTGAGFDTIGVFDRATGNFFLRNANTPGAANEILTLGNAGDLPISGRWSVNATHDGVGVFRPTNGLVYLRNTLTTGFADYAMIIGNPSDRPIAGDWNADGVDSPGIFRPAGFTFYLSDKVTNGVVFGDHQLQLGNSGDQPIAGDWVAQGHDGVGVFRPTNGLIYLKNTLTPGFANTNIVYGTAGDVAVAGHWILGPVPPSTGVLVAPQTPTNPVAPTPLPTQTTPGSFDG